jgi:hypothetical protein
MISSLSSSSGTVAFGVASNHIQAKNPNHHNSLDFNAHFGESTFGALSCFHKKFSTTLLLSGHFNFQFFSKSFLIFTKLASETVAVFAVISFHITFSKYLEKVCLETHKSFITSSIRGIRQ